MGIFTVPVGQKYNVNLGGFTYLNVPASALHGGNVEEVLLLGWLLVLYRLADGHDVHCTAVSWQTSRSGTVKRSRRTTVLPSTNIPLKPLDSVSAALEAVRNAVPKDNGSDKLIWLYDSAVPDVPEQEDLCPDDMANVSNLCSE